MNMCKSRCSCNRHNLNRCRNTNNTTCPCSNPIYSNSCSNMNPFPENYMYGHAYTPNQTLTETFTPEAGLENGSIFPELISPYYPGKSIEFIEYLKCGGNNYGE